MSGRRPKPARLIVLGVGAAVVVAGLVLAIWRPWDDSGSSPDSTESNAIDDPSADTSPEPTGPPTTQAAENAFVVTNTDDSGEGSLRGALEAANQADGSVLITFGNDTGMFDDPQTIELESELPEVTGDVVVDGYIDDRLWQPTGVTLSGAGRSRIITVAPGGSLTLRSLTVADGAATHGAGILNQGSLVLHGVTMMNNEAEDSGGAVNNGGELTVVNSTFTANSAANGGAVAIVDGRASMTHATFADNLADRGGGVYSSADLLLSNTIVANSASGGDCVSVGSFDEQSTNNLIEENDGCGSPISTADPVLEPLNYYNGPAQTLPLRTGSPAINLGENSVSIDEFGQTLMWDQRGNGDPRFVAGFADIGAFEHQAFPDLVVDTADDLDLRACAAPGVVDCPLRAAIELANATPEPDVIVFDAAALAGATTMNVAGPLPEVTSDLTIDASEAGGVTIPVELNAASGVDLELIDVTVTS